MGKARTSYEKAIRLAYASLQANPRKADVMGRLALYYAKQHEFEPARKFIERARAVDATSVELTFKVAMIESLLGDQQAALHELENAVRNGFAVTRIESEPDLSDLRRTPAFRRSLNAWRAGAR
jgi:Flp pilus assembly protein TadD